MKLDLLTNATEVEDNAKSISEKQQSSSKEKLKRLLRAIIKLCTKEYNAD
jgi:hypothetical protein